MTALRAPGRWAAVFAALGVVVLTLWLLDAFARMQFTHHLRDEAAHALALAARGETPYRWTLRTLDDLVGARIFGASNYTAGADGLVIESDGKPFEIGLRMSRPIPLDELGVLELDANVDGAARAQLIVREHLGGEEISSDAFDIRANAATIVRLDERSWQDARDGHRGAPQAAAMLRLRFTLTQGSGFKLRNVVFGWPSARPRLDITSAPDIVDLPSAAASSRLRAYLLAEKHEARVAQLAAIARADAGAPPIIVMPSDARVEQQMAWRKAVYSALPDAIIVPGNGIAETMAQARREAADGSQMRPHPTLHWISVLLFALVLLLARLHPPANARLRALCEVLLTLAGPAWLILGGYFDGNVHKPFVAVMIATFLYAVSLSVPRTWRWNGSARAWALALGVVGIAALIGLWFHRADTALNPIPLKQIVRYFGWALLQQYLLCAVCTERWRTATGNDSLAVYLGALGFALLHNPNAALMIATFFGGLFWCALYLRERSLLPLAVSHALSALTLLALTPRDVLHSAEVSVRFFF
ncbi:MAG TPA: CPBP family intramembrane glutamic endopeptidase [Rudaea sp.]